MQVTAPAPAATLAREYLRVSLDRSGRARSLDEQHGDNAGAAEQQGWRLGEAYRDNSVSASRYSRKPRDGFAELMADLDTGRFGAGVLVIWESSRGSRRVGEWVDLIDVCAERGVLIYVTTHGRTYDPGNGRDRRSLLEDAVDSEYESSKTSERMKRANAANAADGKPHGRVSYGYRRMYDPRTGRLVGQEPHPDEAPVVRELFERLGAGHSLRGIARDFEERGIRSRSGKPFSAAALRSLAV
ncbi:MAG TPA: recombinase family protein, partial [Actinomycetospora sp.]|uniref:recombinase family protein n=1 Tax=Actinomycetospora sp. TaxID=1872135 RepID=UPI002F42DC6E